MLLMLTSLISAAGLRALFKVEVDTSFHLGSMWCCNRLDGAAVQLDGLCFPQLERVVEGCWIGGVYVGQAFE